MGGRFRVFSIVLLPAAQPFPAATPCFFAENEHADARQENLFHRYRLM